MQTKLVDKFDEIVQSWIVNFSTVGLASGIITKTYYLSGGDF